MKQNILIVCYDFDTSKKVADKIADFFSMRVLNEIELFEFDYVPRSLVDMINLRGINFVREELSKTVRNSLDFENTVFVADIGMAETCKKYFEKLCENYVVILLSKDPEIAGEELTRKPYSPEVKRLLCHSPAKLAEFENTLNQISDITIDLRGKTFMDIFFKIVGDIKKIYNMN